MKIFFPLVVLVSFLLQGCLGNKNAINQDVVFLQSAPVCNTEEMCKAMWDAAGEWVNRYSPQGIETYNDEFIRSVEKEVGSDEMDIEVRKIKQPDGSFKIVINNYCSRSLANCTAERNNMIAFNKKLIGFMSAKQQEAKKQVFDDDQDVKKWLQRYNSLMIQNRAEVLSTMLHFPVTYIDKKQITVIRSTDELSDYLQDLKKRFTEYKGIYLKTNSVDVFGRTGRNLYINAIINLYDTDNTTVAAQQIGFHLVKVDSNWLLLSAAVHGE